MGAFDRWIPLVVELRSPNQAGATLLGAAISVIEPDLREDALEEVGREWAKEEDVTLAGVTRLADGFILTFITLRPDAAIDDAPAVRALGRIVAWAHLRSVGVVSVCERARVMLGASSADFRAVQMDRVAEERISVSFSASSGGETRTVIVDPTGRRPDELDRREA